MTERAEPYVLDVDEVADAYADLMVVRLGAPRAESIATFRRMIEAVRQEERERCARIVENAMTEVGYTPGSGETAVANPPIRRMSDVAARIREQGKARGA